MMNNEMMKFGSIGVRSDSLGDLVGHPALSPSIIVLLLLCIFELVYLLALGGVSPLAVSCISILALIYVWLMALSPRSKPENTIYAYLLCFILIPKSLYQLPGLLTVDTTRGDTLFKIIEAISILAICIAVVSRRGAWKELRIANKSFGRLDGILTAMLLVSMICSLYYGTKVLDLAYFNLLNGLVFLYGGFCFIKDIRSIEKIFLILMLGGVELVLEVIIFVHLKLPIVETRAMFDSTGRFGSLMYTDPLSVGVVCILSLSVALYFIHSRKKPILWILVVFLFLPVFHGHERAPMGAMLLVICSYMLLAMPRVRTGIVSIILVLCIFIITSLGYSDEMFSKLDPFLAGGIRQTRYFDSGGLFGRFGNYARGVDVIVYSFPFGVGPGNVNDFMGSSFVRPNFRNISYSTSGSEGYDNLTSGYVITAPHNLYVSVAAEYGLLGIIAMLMYVSRIIAHYKNFRRVKKRNPDILQSRAYLAQVCAGATLIGFTFYYIFQSSPPFYFMFFLFLYVPYAAQRINQSKLPSYTA